MAYINSNNQIRVGVRPWVDSGIDSSANLFFAASGLSETTQRNAVNTLVKDLKRFGLWNKIKAFYPFVGGTADTHKLNLVNTEVYGLTFSGGWIHSSNGIKGNNSNTIANTNLSLRTVFGATSSEHTLGIYINENPSGMSYRSDIGAADGAVNWSAPTTTPSIIGHFNNTTGTIYMLDIPSHDWASYTFPTPSSVIGLTELKRYRDVYASNTFNGSEISGRRTITTTTRYNPIGNVTIGAILATNWTAYSTNRYSSAYVASALTTIESYLMYIAVQRFNTSLNRHVGTGINPIEISYSTTDTLVTNGLKLNLDATSLAIPTEGALTTTLPGQFFKNSPTWTDSSGNGNTGTFRTSGDTRFAEYFISDISNSPEVRFRSIDGNYAKLYQSGYSPDALTTTYSGSDTGTFTFGGWFKLNTEFPSMWFVRGNDYFGGGWSIALQASLNGTVVLNAVPSGSGTITSTRTASTILQSDIWYHSYMIWKPGSYVKVYLNGTLEAQWTNTYTGLRNSSVGFGINSTVFGNTYGHGRSIVGAYHVYDRELTEAEIKQNFNAQRARYNVESADDSDAQAFVVAAGLTNKTQITAVNTLVTALKTAGIWIKMKAIYPFVGGNATSHKFNLKDPRNVDAAFRLTFSGGMTHSSTGVLFGGVNGFADTKFIMNQVYTSSVTNIHVSYYSRTNSISDIMIGMQDDSIGQGSQIYLSDTGTVQTYSALNTDNNWVRTNNSSPSVGFYLVSRTSMTLLKGYKNGISVGSKTTTSSSSNLKSTLPLLLGAVIYKYSSTSYYYGNKESSFATIGDGLTDAESTALYNAVQAYQTALGRQV
jgi:hypothetical protein